MLPEGGPILSVPLVSVNLVTYNHEKYIAAAVQSVLRQTFRDLELVVVNDGSLDGTAEQLEAIRDPRLRVLHQENQGPAAATNHGLAACRGQYVALMSGDDLCHPGRIAIQLEAYRRGGPRVLFSGVDFIDDDGKPIQDSHFAADSFFLEDLTRARILERLFRVGNYFNSITTFAERRILLDSGGYDVSLLQMQDYDLWVRLVKHHDLEILPDRLVQYRIRGGNQNLSSPEPDKQVASLNEHYLVMRRFFDGVPSALFREAFAESLQYARCSTEAELRFEQAQLHLASPHALNRLIALESLGGLLAVPMMAAELAKRYQFGPPQYFRLLRTVNVLNLFSGHESTLFLDTGKGWNAHEQVQTRTNLYARDFCIRFQLPAASHCRGLRWDPMEGRTCRVRLQSVDYQLANGTRHSLEMGKISSTGQPLADGTTVFTSTDPMFFLPIEGPVAALALRGTWESDDPSQTIQRQESNRQDLQRKLDDQEQQITELRRRSLTLPDWRGMESVRRVARQLRGWMRRTA